MDFLEVVFLTVDLRTVFLIVLATLLVAPFLAVVAFRAVFLTVAFLTDLEKSISVPKLKILSSA